MTEPHAAAIEFLEKLRPGGPWVLTAIIPDSATETITATNAEAVATFISANDGVKNIYYSVNPTRKALNKKAAKTDIAAIEFLLSDLDPRKGESPEDAKARYLAALETQQPECCAIIDSGNGVQALWRLGQRIELEAPVTEKGKIVFPEATVKRIADVEARVKALMETIGSVAGTQNIDRILRLPGTTNLPDAKKIKAGRVACPAKLLKFNGATCKLEDFPAAAKVKANPKPEPNGKELSIPKMLKTYLSFPDIGSGDDVAYGECKGRSGLLFSFMRQCINENLSDDTIADACLDSSYSGCAIYNHCMENQGAEYVRRQIKRAHYKQAGSGSGQQQTTSILLSSKDFVAGFKPPDYLVDGLLQRGYVYSFTAPTGDGKTVIALLVAAYVEIGKSIAGREVEKGKVVYFAGENPDDVRSRWIKLCEVMKLDPAELNVYFLDGAKPIFTENFRKGIEAELEVIGPISLLIVDTSVAYFTGDDENSNTQLGNHARMLRSLCTLNGKPTVLVTCHPIKNADANNLIPRGGGAFLNEMDGNLVAIREKGSLLVEVHWHGKWRGPEFNPFSFKIVPSTSEKLKDSKGRLVWTVYAEPVGEAEKAVMEEASRDKSLELLAAMVKHPDASLNTLAEALGWVTSSGEINKSLVRRLMLTLQNDKKVKKDHNRWSITPKGKKSVTNVTPEEEEVF